MCIMGNLKLSLRSIGEHFKIFAYTKTQTVHAYYQQEQPEDACKAILVPLPLETDTQKILSKPQVIPKENLLIHDKHHNYNVGLIKNVHEKRTQCSVIIKSNPIVYKENGNFLLSDYRVKLEQDDNKWISAKDKNIENIQKSIVKSEDNVMRVISTIYQYVLNTLTYGNPIEGLYSYKDALEKGRVDCGGFGTLLAALLGNAGIPNRLVVGFCTVSDKSNNLSMHAWNEAYLPDGSVVPLYPSIEWKRKRGITNRCGGFGYVGSDRVIVSYGVNHRIKIDNKEYILPLLQHPIII